MHNLQNRTADASSRSRRNDATAATSSSVIGGASPPPSSRDPAAASSAAASSPRSAASRLARFRELFGRAGLPAGFIHGDGFLDNILCADDGALAALVDWEDSCVAPYVLDVAVAVSVRSATYRPAEESLSAMAEYRKEWRELHTDSKV